MDALDIRASNSIGGSFLCGDCRRESPYASYHSLSAGFMPDGRVEVCCRCTFCGANNTVARFISDPTGAEAVVSYA